MQMQQSLGYPVPNKRESVCVSEREKEKEKK